MSCWGESRGGAQTTTLTFVFSMPRASYIQKILQPNTWGGAIGECTGSCPWHTLIRCLQNWRSSPTSKHRLPCNMSSQKLTDSLVSGPRLPALMCNLDASIASEKVSTTAGASWCIQAFVSQGNLAQIVVHTSNSPSDYDAIVAAPMADAPVDFCTTLFPATDDLVLSCASQLVAQLKARHYYTDTQNFDLRCQVCKVGLKGEKGAREHAMQTGREHMDLHFGARR